MARWPTVVRTRFRRPPGSILGAILASNMIMLVTFSVVPWELFLPVFRRIIATQALYNLIASASARKSRIRLATHRNRWIFTLFLFSRHRKARSKTRNRGQTWYRKRHPKCNKNHHVCLCFTSRAATLTKPPKMTSRSPPRGGKGPKTDPKAAKSFPRWTLDAPKILFWPFQEK